MQRDPKITLEERLRKLQESEEFITYKGLLNDILVTITSQLGRLLVTPQEIAEHNQRIGIIVGIQKALTMVDAIVKELDRDLEQENKASGKQH